MIDKSNRYINLGLLFLGVVALVLVPAVSALSEYLPILTNVYGPTGNSCGTCHVNSSGGGATNTYGTLFMNQANHATDPKTALIAIGAPPGSQAITAISTPSTIATQEPITSLTETPAETVAQVIETPIPVPTKKSPGVGTIVAIGIIGTIYILRRRK
jgi:hypothetical protein